LNIINTSQIQNDSEKKARKLLEKAEITGSATDIKINTLLRYDLNPVSGITNIIKEHAITDLVLGLKGKGGITESFLGYLTDGILAKSEVTTFVYRPFQPISTIKRHIVVVPEKAEYETGFSFWLAKIWNIAINTGSKIIFYSNESTAKIIKEVSSKHPIEAEFVLFDDWDDFLILSRDIKKDDNILIVMGRKNSISCQPVMHKIPSYLNKYFIENNFLLVYPSIQDIENHDNYDIKNPSLLDTIDNIDTIGKTIASVFKKR
jgi:hypothetical protein